MKHLLDAIQHQFPTTTIVQKLLVGSVPPPTDAVWAAFEELGLNVETFKRSYWTKKEKQVDNSICMAAQNVIFNLKSISQLTKNPHDPSIVKLWCDEIGLVIHILLVFSFLFPLSFYTKPLSLPLLSLLSALITIPTPLFPRRHRRIQRA